MRVLLGGGGSGGHIFPALAVGEALRTRRPDDVELLYAGMSGGVETTIVPDAGLEFAAVNARPLRGRHPLSQIWSTLYIAQGVWEARRIIRRYKPDVVLVTGGYVSIPIGVAARLNHTPLVLYVPDIEPGWAARFLARGAARICVTDAGTVGKLPARKTVVTGYPLRPIFHDLDRPMARARFQLNGEPAVLITGAVQGARSLNQVIITQLEQWLEAAQIIHVCGPNDAPELQARREALPSLLQHRYQLFDYLGDVLPIAMAACDLTVSRAGASVLGELPAAGLPAVLVPLPGGGGHQRQNAAAMERAGAAIVVEDDAVDTRLLPTVTALLQDRRRLRAMQQAACTAAHLDAAERIVGILQEVAR